MKKQKIITLQKKIYERNPDTGEIKSRPIRTASEIIKEQRVVINKLITKIDSMSKKLDEIIEAIDNME
jgi:sucrose-6-phosphate hydrolase SacC (GH32 family)